MPPRQRHHAARRPRAEQCPRAFFSSPADLRRYNFCRRAVIISALLLALIGIFTVFVAVSTSTLKASQGISKVWIQAAAVLLGAAGMLLLAYAALASVQAAVVAVPCSCARYSCRFHRLRQRSVRDKELARHPGDISFCSDL